MPTPQELESQITLLVESNSKDPKIKKEIATLSFRLAQQLELEAKKYFTDYLKIAKFYFLAFKANYHNAAYKRLGLDSQETGQLSSPLSISPPLLSPDLESKPENIFYMGLCYLRGIGVTKAPEVAFSYFQRAKQNLDAQTMLGHCYIKGIGITKNLTQGYKHIKKAADAGDLRALSYLGFCYQNGLGVTKDLVKAVEYYQQAAGAGNTRAQCNLGFCYENGLGVIKDLAKAVEYYQQAADAGNNDAQCNLGIFYENGFGVTKDLANAVKYYQQAADAGNDDAQCNLGFCYERGLGVIKDLAKAVEYYQQAASAGNARAQCNLGVFYENGFGVIKDLAKAVEYYQQAADAGNTVAQYNLGVFYQNGLVVTKDLAKAVEYYKQVAERGFADGQKTLAICYFNGIGVEKNIFEGRRLLKKACKQNHPRSLGFRGCCYEEGTFGYTKDPKKAFKWIKKAADLNDPAAQHILGDYYHRGFGVEVSIETAIQYYQKSWLQNYEDAKINLVRIMESTEYEANIRCLAALSLKNIEKLSQLFSQVTQPEKLFIALMQYSQLTRTDRVQFLALFEDILKTPKTNHDFFSKIVDVDAIKLFAQDILYQCEDLILKKCFDRALALLSRIPPEACEFFMEAHILAADIIYEEKVKKATDQVERENAVSLLKSWYEPIKNKLDAFHEGIYNTRMTPHIFSSEKGGPLLTPESNTSLFSFSLFNPDNVGPHVKRIERRLAL